MSELKYQGVNVLFQSYLFAFLKARHCDDLSQIKCGVPQGDPLSMLLFCLGIEPILRYLN